MTKFIGPEYLIGNAFIYLTDERSIDLKVINRYRLALQKYWNLNNSDALICGEIRDAIYDYCDYFAFIPSGRNAGTIILNSDISIDDLKQRFVWRLPTGIDKDFETIAKSLS